MEVHIWNQTALVADDEAQTATAAIQRQIVQDFAPRWGFGAVLHFVPRSSEPPPGAWVVRLVDESGADGALGYHDDDELPAGIVGVKTCNDDGVPWQACLSHEVLELLLDPWGTIAIQAGRKFYAYEASDPVEGGHPGYAIDGVPLEPFVLPNYFRPGAPGPYSYPDGILTAPLTLAPGGYQLVCEDGTWSQVTGERARASKRVISGRRGRRVGA